MHSWEYEIHDVLRVRRKGQEVLARVDDYEDSLDNTTALYVNLRVSEGKRWGQATVKVYKQDVIEALPDWDEEQRAKFDTSIKKAADTALAKMSDIEKLRLKKFAVKHGLGRDTRSPLDRMIDKACGLE